MFWPSVLSTCKISDAACHGDMEFYGILITHIKGMITRLMTPSGDNNAESPGNDHSIHANSRP